MNQKRRYSKPRGSNTKSNYKNNNINLNVKSAAPVSAATQKIDSASKKLDKDTENMEKALNKRGVNFQSGEMYLQDMIMLSFLANALSNLKEALTKEPNKEKENMAKEIEKQLENPKFKDAVEAYNLFKGNKAELAAIGALEAVTNEEGLLQTLKERRDILENKNELLIKEIPIGEDENGNKIYAKNEEELISKLEKVETAQDKQYRNANPDVRSQNIKSAEDLRDKISELKSQILDGKGIDSETAQQVTSYAQKTLDVVTSSSPTQKI